MQLKSFVIGMIILIFAASFASGSPNQPEKNTVKVIHFINGAQGDKSFFDSAVRGIAEAKNDFNLDVTTIEAGYNASSWREKLDAAANKDYDIMIVGTILMPELLQEVAQKHPDKRFIIYDSSVNYIGSRNYRYGRLQGCSGIRKICHWC